MDLSQLHRQEPRRHLRHCYSRNCRHINSGGGDSPILGTVIAQNIITDEDVDIAISTPAAGAVDIHLNNLLGGNVGVADVCTYDNPGGLNPAGVAVCTGSKIDPTRNYWGCSNGPRQYRLHDC